jgi:hypothetical protein
MNELWPGITVTRKNVRSPRAHILEIPLTSLYTLAHAHSTWPAHFLSGRKGAHLGTTTKNAPRHF